MKTSMSRILLALILKMPMNNIKHVTAMAGLELNVTGTGPSSFLLTKRIVLSEPRTSSIHLHIHLQL